MDPLACSVPDSEARPLDLFFSGADFFTRMEEEILTAKTSIDLEFYYFASDEFGSDLARLLASKCEAGIQIRLIVDAVGCLASSSSIFDFLRSRGIQVRVYHPVFPFLKNFSRRDHRKMVVIDGRSAFLGGFNVGVEYDGRYSGSAAWRDTGAYLDRPDLVGEMQALFEGLWERCGSPGKLHFPRRRRRPNLSPGAICLVPNEGFPHRSLIREEYLAAIIHARRSIELTNPYFIPDHGILRALKKAARRGVEVRLITAGISDVRIARWAGQATYAGLLKAGVRIFEFQGRVLHAKTAVIDGDWFTLGTANIDHWSLFQNLELNLIGRDSVHSTWLSRQFERDLSGSVEIDPEQWKRRSAFVKLRERICFYFRKWL